MAKPSPAKTQRDKQDAVIVLTTALLSARPFDEVLTAEEERGLAVALPTIRQWLATAGLLTVPMDDWGKQDVMRFMALVVRAAVPLRVLPDHEAFRELSDELPF